MNKKIEFGSRHSLKDQQYATALGLSLSEYDQLSHTGFREVPGLDGQPISYYTVISPLNPANILEKLKSKMNKMNMIYVPAETFTIRDMPMDVAV